jgi:anaerobic C4-dicarboxylate transporter DcuA/anaerobic C4-dicarboxylate transporter DcuB
MAGVIVILEGLVVLAAIFLGVRMGGIGLGLWGVLGAGVLIFIFGTDPGSHRWTPSSSSSLSSRPARRCR